jgi:hypothetical protein
MIVYINYLPVAYTEPYLWPHVILFCPCYVLRGSETESLFGVIRLPMRDALRLFPSYSDFLYSNVLDANVLLRHTLYTA